MCCCFTRDSSPPRAPVQKQKTTSPPPQINDTFISPNQYHNRNRSDDSDVLSYLHRGSQIIKICRKRTKSHIRYFFLSNDNSRIMWREAETKSSGGAKTRFVHISEVDAIESGQKNRKEFSNVTSFLMGKKKMPLESFDSQQCISISYGQKKETLHLIALTPNEAYVWVWGLKELVKKLNRGEELNKLKTLPFPLEYSVTANSSRSTLVPDTPATQDDVKQLILKIAHFEKLLSKITLCPENEETFKRVRRRLDNLISHIDDSDPSNPITVFDIKSWKIEFWKIDLDVGALELMSFGS